MNRDDMLHVSRESTFFIFVETTKNLISRGHWPGSDSACDDDKDIDDTMDSSWYIICETLFLFINVDYACLFPNCQEKMWSSANLCPRIEKSPLLDCLLPALRYQTVAPRLYVDWYFLSMDDSL